MNDIETAWLAGIVEGEGTIGKYTYTRPNGNYTKTIMQVEMRDRDIIEKLHSITNCGSVRHKPARNRSDATWVWAVTKRVDVIRLCEAILPYMGERRTAKILSVIAPT